MNEDTSGFDDSMKPMAPVYTGGIPDEVLALILGIVVVVIILCTALVGVVRYRDRAKERRSRR